MEEIFFSMLFNDSFRRKQAIEKASQVRKGGLPPLILRSTTCASPSPSPRETVSRHHLTTTNHDRLQVKHRFANKRI
jgi:hypothetical protein